MTSFEKQLLEQFEHLQELVLNGGVAPQRYLNLGDAARYCGFVDPEKPDPRYRAFKRFCEDEGIDAKPGNRANIKFKQIFDVADLNEVMKRNRRKVMA